MMQYSEQLIRCHGAFDKDPTHETEEDPRFRPRN
jgi:hypothetical protein